MVIWINNGYADSFLSVNRKKCRLFNNVLVCWIHLHCVNNCFSQPQQFLLAYKKYLVSQGKSHVKNGPICEYRQWFDGTGGQKSSIPFWLNSTASWDLKPKICVLHFQNQKLCFELGICIWKSYTVHSAYSELGLGVAPWPPKHDFGGTPLRPNGSLTYLLRLGYHQSIGKKRLYT